MNRQRRYNQSFNLKDSDKNQSFLPMGLKKQANDPY